MRKLYIAALVIVCASLVWGEMKSSVSQWGITFTFDKSYECGNFANGDWWVVGPVTLTAISPNASGGRNGWEVNPQAGKTALDYRISTAGSYSASGMPSLPYLAQPNSSIVKANSRPEATYDGGDRYRLKSAAVLTVLDKVPADNGATVFRPPYMSTYKPLYSTNDLQTDKLPSLDPSLVVGRPSLTDIANRHKHPWLDHVHVIASQYIRSTDSGINYYGASLSTQFTDSQLGLYFNDPIQDKLPALVNYIQMGIDIYGMVKAGHEFTPTGGHGIGRKLPMIFAAVMLDARDMVADLAKVDQTEVFHEDGSVWFSQKADNGKGKVLFGHKFEIPINEDAYWQNVISDQGSRTRHDPYSYIDGGYRPGSSYQLCCNSMPMKYIALALLMMPELRTVWTSDYLIMYADRWVTVGGWATPDPCAPFPSSVTTWPDPPGYEVSYGPDPSKPGDCIRGSGRFPGSHGANKDDGGRQSTFGNFFWKNYRASAPPKPGTGLVKEKRQLTVDSRQHHPTLRVKPNPMNESTRILLSEGTTGPIKVYTAQGKRIRAFQNPEMVWDGRNDAGARVDEGVYYISVDFKGRALLHRVTVVK